MLRKIFSIFLIIMLVGCQAHSQETIQEKTYIDPVKDVFLFDEIDDELKAIIKKTNGNKEYNNYQFKMLGKDIYDGSLVDINDNAFNFIDNESYILEIVSVDCSHCKNMIKNHLNKMIEADATLIQYFNVGEKQDILDFYQEIEVDIPNNIVIISHDDGLNDYIKNVLRVESYPTLVSYKNNKVSFDEYGDINDEELETFLDVSFNNPITIDANLISLDRSIEDVEESLSKDSIAKLESIDNNGKTKNLTLQLIGKKCDYETISNDKSSIYISEIGDYSIYKEKDVVLIYTYLRDKNETDKVEFINSLIESNSDVEYIVVLIEGLESSSNAYKLMNKKFKCKVTSVLGYSPDDFFQFGISDYPTAFFIEKGTFIGAYSNIDNIDNFNKAIKMFIGDDSIALIDNN